MAAWVFLVLSPIIFFGLWHLTSQLTPPPPPSQLSNKRIILLIAHPDDESMFFSPALQALTQPSLQNHLKILCLSTGNSSGLGSTRRNELVKAAVTLGIRRREDIFILDDEKRFPDSMTTDWDEKEIARVLASAFAPQLNTPSPSPPPPSAKESKESKKSKRKSGTYNTSTPTPPGSTTPVTSNDVPRATIDVLLTFDSTGVSGHPNHISLYRGARLFLQNLMRGHSGYACPVSLYTLTSVNTLRKYSSVLDAIPTLLAGVYDDVISGFGGGGKKRSKQGDKVVFVNGIDRYWKSRSAMVDCHKSQMVWFRWGWVGVGRYMVVNDLRRERIAGA